jgi:hypothetical protein
MDDRIAFHMTSKKAGILQSVCAVWNEVSRNVVEVFHETATHEVVLITERSAIAGSGRKQHPRVVDTACRQNVDLGSNRERAAGL